MNNSEFDVIQKYFTFPNTRNDVILAVGDDCACVTVPENRQLLITTDTLISGVHFPEDTSPEDIAYKSLMVNLSDLAAMGAKPAWVTLAISLADINDSWLQAFSSQFSSLLSRYNISLIGGDTTRGKLSITVQAMGLAESGKILRRDQAKTGDYVFVTANIGDAAVGLHVILNQLADQKLLPCVNRLNRPEARVDFASELTSYSRCAIDISDGLVADLGHIVKASCCGAKIMLADVPLSPAVRYYFEHYHKGSIDWSMVLTRGDDYELCFTVGRDDVSAVKALAQKHQLKVTCIGEITVPAELLFIDENDKPVNFSNTGFKHF
ncbi:MAG: thiamine-phosphate kinase [Gammaproteobacteria bacterium]|nr:thiamine-phosphate kinase [Gammaproteobacteria bacterium]